MPHACYFGEEKASLESYAQYHLLRSGAFFYFCRKPLPRYLLSPRPTFLLFRRIGHAQERDQEIRREEEKSGEGQ
jgi:hypothetical protein